jgi:hypothetical protein
MGVRYQHSSQNDTTLYEGEGHRNTCSRIGESKLIFNAFLYPTNQLKIKKRRVYTLYKKRCIKKKSVII